MEIIVTRDKRLCTATATPGQMFVDNVGFGYTLEDAWRAPGVKIKHETCIPIGQYRITISRSYRWKKDMILVYNTDDYLVSAGGISFSGIRIHGGNTVEDTSGCILIAEHRITEKGDVIQGSKSQKLTNIIAGAIKDTEEVWLTVE